MELQTDPVQVFLHRHDNPEISFAYRVPKRAITCLTHTLQCTSSSSSLFTRNQTQIQTQTFHLRWRHIAHKISGSETEPDVQLFLADIVFVKDGRKMYPENFTVEYQGAQVSFVGDLMPFHIDKYGRLFLTPIFLNAAIVSPCEGEDRDIKIGTSSPVDSVHCVLLSQTRLLMTHIFHDQYWETARVPVLCHEKITDLEHISGYYSRLFLVFRNREDMQRVRCISLQTNGTFLLEDVPPALLLLLMTEEEEEQKEDDRKSTTNRNMNNILCIPLCVNEKTCEHGIQIKNAFHFQLTVSFMDCLSLEGNVFTIYGERQGLLCKKKDFFV